MLEPKFFRLFDYPTNLLPNREVARLEDLSPDLATARLHTGATLGWPGWGLLYSLVMCNHPRNVPSVIVETGSNYGATTAILAQALLDLGCNDSKIVTFEIDEDCATRASALWERAGVADMITLVAGDIRQVFEDTLNEFFPDSRCRFALLDASHLEADVRFEFETLAPFLAEDAVVAFDNTYRIAETGEDQRVNGFLRSLVSGSKGHLINLPFCSWHTPGIALWQNSPDL